VQIQFGLINMEGKKMKELYIFIALISFILFPILCFSQSIIKDTTKIPTQYRRGVSLMKGYQTYAQKYAGKNLHEEKKRLYPLGFGTNHLGKVTTGTGVWNELSPNVPMVDYIGVHFNNPDTGFAVGALGTIIKSTDSGSTWITEISGTTNVLLKVYSLDGQLVIATGYDGLILRSTDGGETFTQVVVSGLGSGNDMWGLQILNDSIAWACGIGNALIKTTDGGQTWQSVSTGINTNYWWIDFLTNQYGFIACDGGIVLKTTNGGATWTQHQAGDSNNLFTLDAIDSLHIAAAGIDGKNVYSSDGGETWTQNVRLVYDAANDIKFVSVDTGYAIGDLYGIRKTTNRGASWFAANINVGDWQLDFLQERVGYCVGSGLTLYKTENGYDNWQQLILNDNFYDVGFVNENKGYFLSGSLYRTTDGGMNIIKVNENQGGYTMKFADSLDGFIGATNCKIYKTSDAGENWYRVYATGLADSTGYVSKFYFYSSMIGWAVTTSGGIMKTTDAGENWFTQLNGGSFLIFEGISFVDSLYGWTANDGRRPYKTTDGGQNWIEQTNSDYWHTNDIYFANRDTGWMTDDFSSSLIKTTDGGVTWNTVPEIIEPFKFAFFPNRNHWIIRGTDIYETTNGGDTWTDITNDIPSGMGRFSAPTDYVGYAVGGCKTEQRLSKLGYCN
jgi:photosystem II stability/assembly factor-like uncharacterized protein